MGGAAAQDGCSNSSARTPASRLPCLRAAPLRRLWQRQLREFAGVSRTSLSIT
jgi:hypothetical protein